MVSAAMAKRDVWTFLLAVIGISLFHAAGNAFQGVLQAATLETSVTSYLTTEYGASFAVAGLLVAFLILETATRVPGRARSLRSRSNLAPVLGGRTGSRLS